MPGITRGPGAGRPTHIPAQTCWVKHARGSTHSCQPPTFHFSTSLSHSSAPFPHLLIFLTHPSLSHFLTQIPVLHLSHPIPLPLFYPHFNYSTFFPLLSFLPILLHLSHPLYSSFLIHIFYSFSDSPSPLSSPFLTHIPLLHVTHRSLFLPSFSSIFHSFSNLTHPSLFLHPFSPIFHSISASLTFPSFFSLSHHIPLRLSLSHISLSAFLLLISIIPLSHPFHFLSTSHPYSNPSAPISPPFLFLSYPHFLPILQLSLPSFLSLSHPYSTPLRHPPIPLSSFFLIHIPLLLKSHSPITFLLPFSPISHSFSTSPTFHSFFSLSHPYPTPSSPFSPSPLSSPFLTHIRLLLRLSHLPLCLAPMV